MAGFWKTLFGVEDQEQKCHRENVHDSKNEIQRSISDAQQAKKKSFRALEVAEKAVHALEETQRRIGKNK